MPKKGFFFKPSPKSVWQPWPLAEGYFPSKEALSKLNSGADFIRYSPIKGVVVIIYAVAAIENGKTVAWSCDGKLSLEDIPDGD